MIDEYPGKPNWCYPEYCRGDSSGLDLWTMVREDITGLWAHICGKGAIPGYPKGKAGERRLESSDSDQVGHEYDNDYDYRILRAQDDTNNLDSSYFYAG